MGLMRRRIRPLIPAFIAAGALLFSACSSTETSPPSPPSGDRCQLNVSGAPSTFGATGGERGGGRLPPLVIATWSITTDANWVASRRAPRDVSGRSDRVVSRLSESEFPVVRSAARSLLGFPKDDGEPGCAACVFTLSRTVDSIGAGGGRLTVELTTLTGCRWTAVSVRRWSP